MTAVNDIIDRMVVRSNLNHVSERRRNQARAILTFDPTDKTNRKMRRTKGVWNQKSPEYMHVKRQTKVISLSHDRNKTTVFFLNRVGAK